MGFGDFMKGVAGDIVGGVADIGEGLGSAAVNTVKAGAYVADPRHLDDIAEGVGNAAQYVAKNPGKTWDMGFEIGRAIAKDQLKPQNLLINAALLATGVGASAIMAKTALAARSVEGAVTLSRGERFLAGAGRAMSKADEVLSIPQKLQTRALARVPGGGAVTAARARQAERVMDFAGETGMRGHAGRAVARRVAGGDLAPTGRLASGYQSAAWRLGRAQDISGYRENVRVAGDVVQAVAHPERAARELGQAAWHEYGDDAIRFAAKKAPGFLAKALGGGEEEEEDGTYSPYQPASVEEIGLSQFRLDRTHATRASRRQAGAPTKLGRVSTNSTLPTQIGPKDWYGPQGGYSPGRGFQQQQLPGLTQPADVMGV